MVSVHVSLDMSTVHHQVSLDTEWMEIYTVFSEVKNVVEAILQTALQPVEERLVLRGSKWSVIRRISDPSA